MEGTVAILGAAGAIGKAATRELVQRGAAVRVVGRSADRLQRAFGDFPVAIHPADLESEAGALAATRGVDTAVLTLGLPYTEFGRYPGLMRNLVNACEQNGVRRFLLVTNIYPYGAPQSASVEETHPRTPCSFKGRMRLEQEQVLQSSRTLRWITLRLPDFFGPDAELSYARTLFEAALGDRRAQLIAPANTPHQFVYTNDAGPVIAGLLERQDGWNETYHFAGSGKITVEEFARQIYESAGRRYRRILIPPLGIRWMGLFQPLMRELAEMHYLNATPVNLNDDKLARHLGPLHRTRYLDGIRATLESLRTHPFQPLL